MAKNVARYPLDRSPFRGLFARRKLAKLLGTTEADLQALYQAEGNYQCWDQADAKGKMRSIQCPRQELRRVHERVRDLLMKIEPPGFLFCPVKRRSYVANAAQHAGAREVRTLDVKSYFPSTPSRRVYWFFRSVMGCSVDVAAMLAKLLTVDDHLATGSPVSPVLAFYAFYDAWMEVGALAAAAGCQLTVYIDDATVSGASVPVGLMWAIRQRIYGSGLRYHKQRHFGGGCAQVTGIIVRENGSLALPHKQHQKAHALRLARRQADGMAEAEDLDRRLAGHSAQRTQIARLNSAIR
jgi:hypothetical protein